MPATVMYNNSLYSIGGMLAGQGQATNEVDVVPLSDTAAPTIQAPPQMTVAAGDSVSTMAVPIHVVNDVTDPSGIAGMHLQRSINGGPYLDSLSPWSGQDTIVDPGGSYVYREQYADGAGNLSAWTTGPSFTASIWEETAGAIRYVGPWVRQQLSGALGGSTRSTSTPGASATFTFTGHSVRYIGASTPQSGYAEIIVDGAVQGIYNFAHGATNTVSLSYSWVTAGQHTIEVVDMRGGPGLRLDLDAFLTLS